MGDDEYEDGEISEEIAAPDATKLTTEAEVSASLDPSFVVQSVKLESDSVQISSSNVHVRAADGILPTPTAIPTPILHSQASESNDAAAHKRPYASEAPASQSRHYSNGYSSGNGPNADRSFAKRPCTSQTNRYAREFASRHEVDRYEEDLLVKWPRQVWNSKVWLEFGSWMELLTGSLRNKRMTIEDLQAIVLNAIEGRRDLCPFLKTPQQVLNKDATGMNMVVVLLGNLHPSVVQKFRPELPFFDGCTSVPCAITRWSATRRVETPVGELLFRVPRPMVDTKNMPIEELYYGHELTFLMSHSFGFDDELLMHPMGTFTRKSQPQGGTWILDGDLLHLQWRQQHKTAERDDGEDADASKPISANSDANASEEFMLDVLVAEDASMHFFSTDKVTDHAYAHDVPEHLQSRRANGQRERKIRLSLVGAVVADVPRGPDGKLLRTNESKKDAEEESEESASTAEDSSEERPLCRKDFEYFILSKDELRQHGYPIDVATEQAKLMAETDRLSRDQYVQTRPRRVPSTDEEEGEDEAMEEATPVDSLNLCALDCEMCETDLGMELTRVTVINVKNDIIYDQLVKPQSTIINYHTEFSGITEEILQSTRTTLADVQRALLSQFLFEDTILVGHSLPSDLRALRIVHPTICDTAILYPHARGFPFKTSLKYLTKTFLAKDIQTKQQAGHDSAEDATAALELLLKKVRKGPSFGIPSTAFVGSAYDTVVDKLCDQSKRMLMLQYKQSGPGRKQVEEAKPWQLFATGELERQAQSPFTHVMTRHQQELQANEEESTHAISNVEQVTSWDALKSAIKTSTSNKDALCWVQIDQATVKSDADAFLLQQDVWIDAQKSYCQTIDRQLQQLRDEVLPENTMLMVVPQADLSLLRYLKGLRTRAKWKEASPEEAWTDDMQAAVTDAFRGTMESCAFFLQK